MPVENKCRFLAGSGERRMLRAALALGAATVLGAGGAGIANAESPIPTTSVVLAAEDDVTAVTQLKQNYFANIDAKDWSAVRALFAPDAVVDTTASFGPYLPSRDLFVAFTSLTLSLVDTKHQSTADPDITFNADGTATVIWQMQDDLVFADLIGVRGTGVYTDRYVKVGDEWVVKYSRLNRTSLAVVSPFLEETIPEFVEVWNSEGPVAALQYAFNFGLTTAAEVFEVASNVLNAVVNIVGSSVPTAEMGPPSAASTVGSPNYAKLTDVAADFPNDALAISAPASTEYAPATNAARLVSAAAAEADGAPEAADVRSEEQAEPVTTVDLSAEANEYIDPVESALEQPADNTADSAETIDATGESPSKPDDSGDSPNAADAKDDSEPNKPADAKDDAEPNKPADAKDDAEPKKSA
jgi:hypothetical protein